MKTKHMVFAFFAVICFSAVGWAETSSVTAKTFIQNKHENIYDLLKENKHEKSTTAYKEKLAEQIDSLLDYQELAKRSLGKHWAKKTEAQKEEFSLILKQLVERNYQKNLERTFDYKIKYVSEEKENDNEAIVKTLAKSKKNKRSAAVSIDYHLHKSEGSWKVFDVETDGASMVRSYNSQFNRIIRKEGWEGLMAKMNSKLNSDESK